jgi:hypothetical protein
MVQLADIGRARLWNSRGVVADFARDMHHACWVRWRRYGGKLRGGRPTGCGDGALGGTDWRARYWTGHQVTFALDGEPRFSVRSVFPMGGGLSYRERVARWANRSETETRRSCDSMRAA